MRFARREDRRAGSIGSPHSLLKLDDLHAMQLLDALAKAQQISPIDPLDYITRMLGSSKPAPKKASRWGGPCAACSTAGMDFDDAVARHAARISERRTVQGVLAHPHQPPQAGGIHPHGWARLLSGAS